MELLKSVRIAGLFDIYGSLLTKRQQDIMNNYFNFDLSFGEIGQNLNISRSAVQDSVKKSIVSLEKYESLLHLYEKRSQINEALNKDLNKDELLELIRRLI